MKLAINTNIGKTRVFRDVLRNYQLYLFLLPGILCFLLFNYLPMYGVQIAFRDYKPSRGLTGSEWVGLKHFITFLSTSNFISLLHNTLKISVYSLIFGFPITVLFALFLNEIPLFGIKRFVQTVTYAPHFISVVVLVSMMVLFFSKDTGIITQFLTLFGFPSQSYITKASLFPVLYIGSGIWQHTGWSAIIYLAALAGIDPQLHESAVIDGASRLQRIWHINIPGIFPTISIMFILQASSLMNVGYEKAFLMQFPLNLETSEIISTYVYKIGLVKAQLSLSSAVGLLNSLVNLILLFIVNTLVKKLGQEGLF
jgi:putative aldouronate transport system permease protein